MLILAHIGYTTGAVKISQRFALRRPLDYRLVVLMAILPLAEAGLRALFGVGIPGSLPFVQHLTLWVTFLGAALAAHRRVHGVRRAREQARHEAHQS